MSRLADTLDITAIRHRLDGFWNPPVPHGEDSWMIDGSFRRIIVSIDLESEPGVPWVHASMSYHSQAFMPSYRDLKQLHTAVFGDGHAYQCFVPEGEHISIRENVLHLWGRLDGQPVLPNFGRLGTI